MEPYLDEGPREIFDAWHRSLVQKFSRDLTFPEIRKGVQALSSLYVARRGRLAPSGGGAFDGAGKRAGFALFFAPLHFLTIYHAVREIEFDALPFARLWDLGCGTGVGGAAWGLAQRFSAALETGPARGAAAPGLKIVGVDRASFPLDEAAATYRAFGLRSETRRLDLGGAAGAGGSAARPAILKIGSAPSTPPARRSKRPEAASPLRGDDAVILAYTLNELPEPSRETLLHDLMIGGRTSRPLVIVEPVARRVAPWWSLWERALGDESLSLHSLEFRKRVELPAWLAEMDRAAGVDHTELTARVMGVIG
ncbi:MAG: hypothetical protein HY049_09005 [Acidobacteria bacterium]|nr:hypothetical protein [Acidobacteriota bacterium]